MIPIKKWDTIYVLLDLHGTVIPNGLHSSVQYSFINHTCKEVLQWFSKRKDIKLILWTSSYVNETATVLEWLEKNGVIIDYVNCNLECKDTEIACFYKKPYYNILIDDRGSFDPNYGWLLIARELELATGENILTWSSEQKTKLLDGINYYKSALNNLIVFD